MDILLHADIFFYKILQLDIHAEWDRTLKQKREFFRIQTTQIDIIKLFAKTFIMGTKITFLPGKAFHQPVFYLID